MKDARQHETSVSTKESSQSGGGGLTEVVVNLLSILRNREQFNKLTDALTQVAVPYGDNADDSTLR